METKINFEIANRILIIRGQRIMLDYDLAKLYGVETKYLTRQVTRNKDRFPDEFVFQLTQQERDELVTNWHQFEPLKHSSTMPRAFTEHGVAMLSSVLRSKQAIAINLFIIKTFIRMRQLIESHSELAKQLTKLESKSNKHDEEIQGIIQIIQRLLAQEEKPKRRMGFHAD